MKKMWTGININLASVELGCGNQWNFLSFEAFINPNSPDNILGFVFNIQSEYRSIGSYWVCTHRGIEGQKGGQIDPFQSQTNVDYIKLLLILPDIPGNMPQYIHERYYS